MALVAEVFIGALNVRMSILAMSWLMRPYTLTQTDQYTVKSSCNGAGHTFFDRWQHVDEHGSTKSRSSGYRRRRLLKLLAKCAPNAQRAATG